MTRPLILLDERNLGRDRPAVQIETDGSLLVRAVGDDTGSLKALEHFAAGMSIYILCAHRNDRVLSL